VIAGVNIGLALLAFAVLPLATKMVGVAAAYAVTYAFGLALSTAVLRRRVGGLDGAEVVRTYVRLVLAAASAGLVGWLASWLVGRSLGDGVGGSMVSLAVGGVVLLAGYIAAARALRVREMDLLIGTVRARVGR